VLLKKTQGTAKTIVAKQPPHAAATPAHDAKKHDDGPLIAGRRTETPENTATATDAKKKPAKDVLKMQDDAVTEKPKKIFAGESRGGAYEGPGFRVQIYNGPDRNKAARIKAEFMRNYPGVPTYLTYSSPAYRVKIGDFRNRGDASPLYKEALGSYSPCMIVPDNITITGY
jgi:hypothetical protein